MNRLLNKLNRRSSDLILMLCPRLVQMPAPIQPIDDPFFPFGKAVINSTADLLAGYLFDLAAYMALGAAGMVALERTIAYVPDAAATILHAPFASADYATAAGAAAFNVDAVTLSEARYADAYLKAGVAAFAPDGAGQVGVYLPEQAHLTIGDVRLRLLGEDMLYADSTERFAEVLRARIEAEPR